MDIPSKNHVKFQSTLSTLLLQIGANPYHSGYRYIKECVTIILQKHGAIKSVVKELYAEVAKSHGITTATVERSIRHCINSIWNKAKIDVINKSFGISIFTRFDMPTNGQFVMLVAEKLSHEFFFTDNNELICLSDERPQEQ